MSSVTDESLESNEQLELDTSARWYAVQVASGCENGSKPT